MLPLDEPPPEAFRVGRGYIDYWMHDAEAHWTLSVDERIALRSLQEALHGLLAKRNALEDARRAFVPVSSLRQRSPQSEHAQAALYSATQDFFGQYYKCLTTLAGFVSNFAGAFDRIPSRNSMEKFITWLEGFALFPSATIPLLRDARAFRTLFEHPTLMPLGSTWGTVAEPGRPARMFFHGPTQSDGSRPDGTLLEPEAESILPPGHTWVRYGPDEDLVVWALAVQLNALLPRCQHRRMSALKREKCNWKPTPDPESPDGYPIFAGVEGVVVASSDSSTTIAAANPPRKLPSGLNETETIDYILGKYFAKNDGDSGAD